MATPRVQNIKTGSKVAGIAVITVLLFILVVNAMRNPVAVDTRSYSADFTDASGLHPNGDVRFRGKRVGKVTSVELKQGSDKAKPLAHVEFTLDADHTITDTTSLAIKYQNLTGVRYVDVRPGDGDAGGQRVGFVPADRTVPSFDITRLFNGLQPVLVTMNAKDINQFSENAIALLQGDGGGLGPMLDSTEKLTKYAKSRQKVISTLTSNLARVTESMGGRNENVMRFMKAVDEPITASNTVLDQFAITASAGPGLFEPLERILAALEIQEDTDMAARIKSVFKDATTALGVFELMPNTLDVIKAAGDFQPGIPPCSKGNVQIPLSATFFIKGSEVVLCNP